MGLWVTGLMYRVGRHTGGKMVRRIDRNIVRWTEIMDQKKEAAGARRCRWTKKDSGGGPHRPYTPTRDLVQ